MGKLSLNEIVLQNILHNTDMGIHVIDKNRKTIFYNDAMASLEGLKSSQVINKDLLGVFPSLDENSSTLIKVLNSKEPIMDKTQTYLNFKGQKITAVNTTVPLYSEGEIVGALEISKDITYLKRLSDRLMELQYELNSSNYENIKSRKNIRKYRFTDIIGADEKMVRAVEIGKRASNSPSSVLLYGETGTGKELFAQSIHYGGIRKNGPFIAQNCAAIPEALFEGILFGTDKGGFTGAIEREGIFEQANGGTLLLDEINSMPLGLQAKLLRVIQEGYVRRIGGVKDIPVDVKIIATTNEKPIISLKKGKLRKDLYYRLNVIYIDIPPLRERKSDIHLLSKHFIEKYNILLGKNIIGIDEKVLDLFYNHSWPGNVRELENSIEAAMNYVSNNKEILEVEDFQTCPYIVSESPKINFQEMDKSLPDYLSDVEKGIIAKELENNDYNISRTAEKLGIKRQSLQHKIKKYGMGAK